MATYKQSGVDIDAGDEGSKIAYSAAKETFAARAGMIGKPVVMEGGFSGALDFGDFYLVQNCDGVGSKVAVADAIGKYDTLGYDLLAMVCDDAVCIGAETVSITNTIDTEKVSPPVIKSMMEGLKKACIEQKIVIPGGEIAELPGLVNGNSWNSTAIGIVAKDRLITGAGVAPGDKIIGLRSTGFRSNGFSLIRHVLQDKFGKEWFNEEYIVGVNWGEAVLAPSIIYSAAVLEIVGRFGKDALCDVKAIAHITGGGIPGNITRVLGNYGARLDGLFEPDPMMLKLQEYGNIPDEEAYRVWNMGSGMVLVSNEFERIHPVLVKNGIESKIIGEVVAEKAVSLKNLGYFKKEEWLTFNRD